MQTYLVGGAVRDELLGLAVHEKDYVVVGATPEEMIKKGFKPVGKDFPVFLHPKTQEEYALARSEKKVARGYKGFEFHTSPDITLEEDLKRRDITINAIAKNQNGQLFDPYHGANDLKHKIIRHVSPAFIEDPVRILRVARFQAKLPDFSIAPETLNLMKKMVTDGEVDALVPERVWQELHKALKQTKPSLFIQTLLACGALKKIMPELLAVKNLKLIDHKNTPLIRFALLCHGIDNGHIKSLCQRLRIPSRYTKTAVLFSSIDIHKKLTAENILKILLKLDALRKPERVTQFKQFLQTLDDKNVFIPLLEPALNAAKLNNIPELIKGLEREQIPKAIYEAQRKKINLWLNSYNP